jgi:uncharacterized SAM-binding protein YcdF (DUF218 family)
MEILIVLGSPNGSDGTLSKMAESRLDCCIRLYQHGKHKILLTGGFGLHFNVSEKPHAWYLKQKLAATGIAEEDVLGMVESGNSVEDATLSKWILQELDPARVTIITSDYHLERAKLIFKTVYAPYEKIDFHAASSVHIDPVIIDSLIKHEKIAVQDLLENGVRF